MGWLIASAAVLPLVGFAEQTTPAMNDPTFSQVVRALKAATVPVEELNGKGHVAVTSAAGRVIALSFSKDGPNLLWTNPQLGDTQLLRTAPETLVGNIGGDRAWFSPELRYHWHGKPDWATLTNYEVPKATDPGNYRFAHTREQEIQLVTEARLPVRGSNQFLDLALTRTVRMTPPPLPLDHPAMRFADYVGIEAVNDLRIEQSTQVGWVDLWHLLQVPAGTTLIIPLRPGHKTQPLSYGLPGSWHTSTQAVVWQLKGRGNAKLGIAAEALTGRSAALRRLPDDKWCLLIRQFPLNPTARYGDHPYGEVRDDQVFQAWDGLGFGEMEYHSPLLDADRGPRSLQDINQLWAFGGSAEVITELGRLLLGLDIRSFFPPEAR